MIATPKQTRPVRDRVARVRSIKRRLGTIQEHLTSIGVRSRSTDRESREFILLSHEMLIVMRKLVAMKMLYAEALRRRGAIARSEAQTVFMLSVKIESFNAACRATDCPNCQDWLAWSENFLARLEPRMPKSAAVVGNVGAAPAANRAWLARCRVLWR